MSKKRSLAKSFGYAIEGFIEALKEEPNFRIHTFLAIVAVILAYNLSFTLKEWAILAITISFVLVTELFNTVAEAMVDLVSPEIKDKAKLAKDVSAAAVLITALLAIGVFLLLFLPKLI